MWAAEPTLDERKRLGFQVMIFLIVFTGLLYFTKKKVWHDVQHDPDAGERERRIACRHAGSINPNRCILRRIRLDPGLVARARRTLRRLRHSPRG